VASGINIGVVKEVLTIGNSQGFASDGAASRQNFTAASGSHFGQKSMGSYSFDFARLIGHFCHDQHLLAIA
jgi:hypothetical protein